MIVGIYLTDMTYKGIMSQFNNLTEYFKLYILQIIWFLHLWTVHVTLLLGERRLKRSTKTKSFLLLLFYRYDLMNKLQKADAPNLLGYQK